MTAAELRYLIAIDALYDGTSGIKLIAITEKMGVSKVSVYRAVERLEKGGYAMRDERNKVVLTAHGEKSLAEYMVLQKWLAEHLETHCGVSGDIAYRDAVDAVCALGDESRRGLWRLIHGCAAEPLQINHNREEDTE